MHSAIASKRTVEEVCRRFGAALVAFFIAMAPGVAMAATPDEDAAALLFREGYERFEAQDFAAALEKFQRAHQLVQNVHTSYFLARSLAALGRCGEALPRLVELRGGLGEGADAVRAEGLRAADEASCRLSLGASQLERFACEEASELLQPIEPADLPARDRRRASDLGERAHECVEAFGQDGEASQRAAALHAESRDRLASKRYAEALVLADSSLAARDSALGRLARGLALAGMARCRDALPLLASSFNDVPARDRALHAGSLDACRLMEARRLVDVADCGAAMPLLDALAGRLRGADERWRAEKGAWCLPRATEFLTDTVARKAAYTLFIAARTARDDGRLDAAADRYGQALALVDEPIVRRELAGVEVVRGRCAVARERLEGIPAADRTQSDHARIRACGVWAPLALLKAGDLVRYVDSIEGAVRALDADDRPAARVALDDAWALGRSPAVRAAGLDLIYESGDCVAFVSGVRGAPAEVRALVRDLRSREGSCNADEEPSVVRQGPAAADRGDDPLAKAALAGLEAKTKPEKRRRFPWGWVAGGVAVAAAVTVTAILLAGRLSGESPPEPDFTWEVP